MIKTIRRVAARIPSYLVYARERPSWLLLLVFGRITLARNLEAWLRRAGGFRREPGGPVVSPRFRSPSIEKLIADLERDGACEGLVLEPKTLSQIRRFADTHPCFPRDGSKQSFLPAQIDTVNRDRSKDLLAAYYFATVEACEAINELKSDPALLDVARRYVGQASKAIRVRMWWSFPGTRYEEADLYASAQDKFHFDLNDWRTLKAFFYLTDVEAGTGAHVYIKGSHRKRGLRHQFALLQGQDRDALADFYGPEPFTTITGPAGTGFLEDPFVFHTGSRALTGPRLILELEFGPYDPSPSYRYGVLG